MKKYNIEQMEQWEINELKDNLVMYSEDPFSLTLAGDVFAKAWSYINYLEDKSVNVNRAIKLLRKNDYAVIKKTPRMLLDERECEKISENGEDKECFSCACNVCTMQY